jgi:hypothetical protein
MDTLGLIDQNDNTRSKAELTHPTDLVKGRDYVLRVATHAVNGDHLIPDSLNIVACTEKFAKALAGYAELFLHAALDANVDGCLLFLEFLAKCGDLHEVVWGLEVLSDGLCCGYCWCGHGRSPCTVRCAVLSCAVLVTRIVVVGMLGPSVPANYRFHEKIAV